MELNHTSIHVGCITFSGNGSNLSDPSETLLAVRLPCLSPREEESIKSAILPVVVEMIKQFERQS